MPEQLDPMCKCGHPLSRHSSRDRFEDTPITACDEPGCGCDEFTPTVVIIEEPVCQCGHAETEHKEKHDCELRECLYPGCDCKHYHEDAPIPITPANRLWDLPDLSNLDKWPEDLSPLEILKHYQQEHVTLIEGERRPMVEVLSEGFECQNFSNETRRRRGALRIVETYIVVNNPYSRNWTKLFKTAGGEWFLEEKYRNACPPSMTNHPMKMARISHDDALKLIDESFDQINPPTTENPS